tara:strand:+ start:13268 stop:13747 length:480 start_codon:yes stop_codon:yes gene_type:complete
MGLFKDCGCGCDGKKQEAKFIISIISALVFFIVANPETFKLVRRLVGSWVATPTGCPSMLGLLLHAVVFMLVVWGMMNIKKEAMEGEEIVEEEMMMEAPATAPAPEPEPVQPMTEPVVEEPPSMMSKVLGMDMDMADAMESGTYKTCGCSDGSRVVIMN